MAWKKYEDDETDIGDTDNDQVEPVPQMTIFPVVYIFFAISYKFIAN